MFTVATYNIRKAMGTDRRRQPERILAVLNEMGADIVALQEADLRLGVRKTAIPVEMIRHETDYIPIWFETETVGIGWHGNAILVRHHIDILKSHTIALPTLEPRGAVGARLRVGGHEVEAIGMHLSLSAPWRKRQAQHLMDYVTHPEQATPSILMGDLNEWSLHGGCHPIFAQHCRNAHAGPSYHSSRPVARLDRIMVTDGLRIIAAGTHHSSLARRASDHLPVWAKLAF